LAEVRVNVAEVVPCKRIVRISLAINFPGGNFFFKLTGTAVVPALNVQALTFARTCAAVESILYEFVGQFGSVEAAINYAEPGINRNLSALREYL
jgi:hypothetical protein